MRLPCPVRSFSQSLWIRLSDRSQQRQSVPQIRGGRERVQLVSGGAQEGQVLGSRSSAPGAEVSAEGGSCSHFCPPSCPCAARTSLYSTLREASDTSGPAQV